MRFIYRNRSLLLLVTFFLLLCIAEAHADSGIFSEVREKIIKVLNGLKGVIYIMGGFGLIAFSFAAVFGKISFKHLATISLSLLLVSSMGLFIQYFSNDEQDIGSKIKYGDFLNAFPPDNP